MVYGYGRGMARGFGFGAGSGPGRGRGAGFGFRGASPPWPYVGRGRRGLPRCSYPGMRRGFIPDWDYGTPWNAGYDPAAAVDSEKEVLKDQAEMMKGQLEQIEKRLQEPEEKEED
jgi:hypothetical protein